MKKVFLYILLVLITLGVLFTVYYFRNPEKLIERTIRRQSEKADSDHWLSQEATIKLVTVGTAAPLPGNRLQTCSAVFLDGKFFVFDLGPGTVNGMEQLDMPLDKLEAVFITHWHSDHFIDLPYAINRSWQLGRKQNLEIYGPTGLDSIMNGIKSMLFLENRYRVAHHGSSVMPPEFSHAQSKQLDIPKTGKQLVYDKDGIKVFAFRVCHEPVEPALGYRIEYKEKVLVIGGDTKKCPNLVSQAEGADLLLHEAMVCDLFHTASEIQKEMGNIRNAAILKDITDYHTPPLEVAQAAADAKVKMLVLHHLAPAPDNPLLKRQFLKGMQKIYSGKIKIARDGEEFDIF